MYKTIKNSILIVLLLSVLGSFTIPSLWKNLPLENEFWGIISVLFCISIVFVVLEMNYDKWTQLYYKGYNLLYKFIGYISGGIAVLYFIRFVEWDTTDPDTGYDMSDSIPIPEDVSSARFRIFIVFLIIWAIATILDRYMNRGLIKENGDKTGT